jgi:hypothetical protein
MPGKGGRKTFDKKVKQIVQEQMAVEIENKHAITDYRSISIKRSIPSGVVLNGQGNFFKLLPEIDQSPTGEAGRAYNTRIGNEINLKSLSITGALNYTNSNVAQNVYENGKIALRVMILRAKEANDVDLLFDNMPTNQLIRFGDQSFGNPNGPKPFGGQDLDAFRDINRDIFSVRYDKVFYLDAPVLLPGAGAGAEVDLSVVPSRSKIFKHELTFGKHGLKLKYSASDDIQANNFPYFMVMGYSSMSSGSALPDDDLATVSLSCVSTYTDA